MGFGGELKGNRFRIKSGMRQLEKILKQEKQ
jgi:hypothetical protein